MRGLFRWDSPVMQKLAKITNLIMLNILWIVCSIPVITMGAATTALYYTIFQMQTKEEDAVLRTFFRGFVQNFKQATLLWLPLMEAMALLGFNLLYMNVYGGSTILWIAVIFMSVAVLLVQSQLLPMLARFEMKNMAIVKTSCVLTVMHFLSCLLMAALNVIPIVAFFADLDVFMQWLPLWSGLWFALIAYINGRMLLKIWKKHMPAEEVPAETEALPEEDTENAE